MITKDKLKETFIYGMILFAITVFAFSPLILFGFFKSIELDNFYTLTANFVYTLFVGSMLYMFSKQLASSKPIVLDNKLTTKERE